MLPLLESPSDESGSPPPFPILVLVHLLTSLFEDTAAHFLLLKPGSFWGEEGVSGTHSWGEDRHVTGWWEEQFKCCLLGNTVHRNHPQQWLDTATSKAILSCLLSITQLPQKKKFHEVHTPAP